MTTCAFYQCQEADACQWQLPPDPREDCSGMNENCSGMSENQPKREQSTKPITSDMLQEWIDECQTLSAWGKWRTDWKALTEKINKHFGCPNGQ